MTPGRSEPPAPSGVGDQSDPFGDVTLDIAAAVRSHRLAAGLTMRELATRAGMSQPFLSNLENSRAMPSIATLYKIASALGVSPREFLPETPSRMSVTRAGEGSLGPVSDEPGSATTRVVAGAPGRLVEAHTYVAEPSAGMGDWFEHDGEDLLYVVSGGLRVELGTGQVVDLAAGDVMWHDATIPHRWSQLGDATTELLCVHARRPSGAMPHGETV